MPICKYVCPFTLQVYYGYTTVNMYWYVGRCKYTTYIYIYIATKRFLRFHEYKNITTHKKYYTALKPGLPNPLAITATRTIKSCSWYTTRFFPRK